MKTIVNGTHHQRKINLVLFLTLLILTGTGQATEQQSKESLIAANPILIGKWTGEGRFLDVALDKDLGKVPLEVEIKQDNTVAGRIGDANLTQTSIHKARYGFEIHAILDSRVKTDKTEMRDHLIILLVTPVKDKEGRLESDANFHLKTNYAFDFAMRVGAVLLKNQGETPRKSTP